MFDVFNLYTGESESYNAGNPYTALQMACLAKYNLIPNKRDIHVGIFSIGFRDLAVFNERKNSRKIITAIYNK